MSRTHQWWAASMILGSLMLAGCGWHKVSTPAAPHWMTQNAAAHTVTVRVYAGWDGNNNDMNFDGYGNGAMTVTVPKGWQVKVHFLNTDESQSHSAMIVPFRDHALPLIIPSMVAFPKAYTPKPNEGSGSNAHATFTFVANRAGHYALVCGVPTHAEMGMWDRLTVSSTAAQAHVSIAN